MARSFTCSGSRSSRSRLSRPSLGDTLRWRTQWPIFLRSASGSKRPRAELIAPQREAPFERFFFRDPVNGYVFEIVEESGLGVEAGTNES